jgi:hypothetical protein
MKFCPVVPEICRGQVHGPRKKEKEKNNNNNNNDNKKRSKNNKSPKPIFFSKLSWSLSVAFTLLVHKCCLDYLMSYLMGNNSVKNVNTSGDLHGLYACFSKIPIWLDHTHMDWLFEVTHSNTPLHCLRRILSFFSYFCLQIEIEN